MSSQLEILRNRYERLIQANYTFGFVRTEKASKYLRVLKSIKNQISFIENQNLEANKNSEVSNFLKASKGMSGFQILMNVK